MRPRWASLSSSSVAGAVVICIKPLAGTASCQAAHLGYLVAGSLHVAHDDGTEVDLSPGDAYRTAPGHDAWVVGDEPVVGLEFEPKTAETYARTE